MTEQTKGLQDLQDNWRKIVEPYKVASTPRSILQLFTTLVPFLIAFVISYYSLKAEGLLAGLLYASSTLLGGFLLVRVFIILHDCGHQSFFKSKKLNKITGGFLGILVVTPSSQWSKEHARHHATSGNLDHRGFGDIYTCTLEEYNNLPTLKKIGYRLYRNPYILMTFSSWFNFFIKQRIPLGISFKDTKSWLSIVYTNIGIITTILVVSYFIGFTTLLMIYLPMVMITASIGMWLFYIQHQYEGSYWERSLDWNHVKASIFGSSYYDLPKIFHWLSGNIGYHHIHHLCSKIPNYNLPKCFNENEVFRNVKTIRFLESFKSAKLAIWHESEKRLISFKQAKLLQQL